MRSSTRSILFIVGAFASTVPARAQNLVIYPARGQSAAQQDQDRYQCHRWAVQQSGYDPTQAAGYAPAPGGPNALRGGAGGAAVGAVGGAIGGNAGKGAAIGAATGAVVGGVRRRHQAAQQQSQMQQYTAMYNRSLTACMEGRGYTVR